MTLDFDKIAPPRSATRNLDSKLAWLTFIKNAVIEHEIWKWFCCKFMSMHMYSVYT